MQDVDRAERVNEQSLPKQAEGVVGRRGPDEVMILLDTSSGEYFTLNEVGGRIWELCDGTRSVADIVATLVTEYDASSDDLRPDVLELLGELDSNGLVRA